MGEGGETDQSEVLYSLALVRVRATRLGAARVLVALVKRARARASLVMVRAIVVCGDWSGDCSWDLRM